MKPGEETQNENQNKPNVKKEKLFYRFSNILRGLYKSIILFFLKRKEKPSKNKEETPSINPEANRVDLETPNPPEQKNVDKNVQQRSMKPSDLPEAQIVDIKIKLEGNEEPVENLKTARTVQTVLGELDLSTQENISQEGSKKTKKAIKTTSQPPLEASNTSTPDSKTPKKDSQRQTPNPLAALLAASLSNRRRVIAEEEKPRSSVKNPKKPGKIDTGQFSKINDLFGDKSNKIKSVKNTDKKIPTSTHPPKKLKLKTKAANFDEFFANAKKKNSTDASPEKKDNQKSAAPVNPEGGTSTKPQTAKLQSLLSPPTPPKTSVAFSPESKESKRIPPPKPEWRKNPPPRIQTKKQLDDDWGPSDPNIPVDPELIRALQKAVGITPDSSSPKKSENISLKQTKAPSMSDDITKINPYLSKIIKIIELINTQSKHTLNSKKRKHGKYLKSTKSVANEGNLEVTIKSQTSKPKNITIPQCLAEIARINQDIAVNIENILKPTTKKGKELANNEVRPDALNDIYNISTKNQLRK